MTTSENASNEENNRWSPFPQKMEVSYLRELRHSPCLMSPISFIMLLIIALFSVITLLLQFPGLVIGFFLRPLLSRFHWVIEFLYPSALGRWGHFLIMRLVERGRNHKPTDKNHGYHSRAVEVRLEIVKGLVFVHPLPQLLDNLGYLVVCSPPKEDLDAEGIVVVDSSSTPLGNVHVTEEYDLRLVAFVVDCGDADAVARQLELISEFHYNKRKIYVQSILSTHKHHDHTAGNRRLRANRKAGDSIKLVVGGAVDRVPGCNFPVADGDFIPLPKYGQNDMNEFVEVEAVATPAHTRGSITYVMRPKSSDDSLGAAFLFSGDTMFSAGGGVPFEADFDKDPDENASNLNANTFLTLSAGMKAGERCFAQILYRSVRDDMRERVTSDKIILLPGHEYTLELLGRQMSQPTGEHSRWKNFAPQSFFQAASRLYLALHRRTLPHSTGKLLVAPSSMRRELDINPHLRMLRRRAETVMNAIRLWHRHFAINKLPELAPGTFGEPFGNNNMHDPNEVRSRPFVKSESTQSQWNLDAADLNRDVFTTVYADELDELISDLAGGKVRGNDAARRLQEMKRKMANPVVVRRPLPGTLPSDRLVHKGLLGLAILGSPPCALTASDSKAMKLPAPAVSSSDRIRVSKKRLVGVLYWLGVLTAENDGRRFVGIIDLLWRETLDYAYRRAGNLTKDEENDVMTEDEVEIGALKWILYGIPSSRSTCLPKFCMPCARQSHPAHSSGMERSSSELVRHDVYRCLLCKSATGCADPELHQAKLDTSARSDTSRSRLGRRRYVATSPEESDASCIEVVPSPSQEG